jgi:hypothetical protein
LNCTCPDFECAFAVGVVDVGGGEKLRVTELEKASSNFFNFTI